MKRLKSIGLFIVFISCCSLYGCLDLIGSAVITGVDAYSVKHSLEAMDVQGKIKGDVSLMKTASTQVFEEMGITIIPNQNKDRKNCIQGKTDKHEIIEVAWESVTSKMFSIGIKARYPGIGFFETNKDINLAVEIITLIDEKYKAGITASATKMLKVVKNGLVRQGPGQKFKVIAVVKTGSILFNLGRQKSWHKVQTETGKVGFIYYTIVKPEGI